VLAQDSVPNVEAILNDVKPEVVLGADIVSFLLYFWFFDPFQATPARSCIMLRFSPPSISRCEHQKIQQVE
jgi:hypothetical protein